MNEKYISFPGKICIVGCGSIGQAVLPLINRHIDIRPEQITVLTSDERGHDVAKEFGVNFVVEPVTRENYKTLIPRFVAKGDFLLNLSVDISSPAMIELCRELGVLYLDTVTEPWAGEYANPSLTPSERSNYALRENVRKLVTTEPAPTAVLTCGANPGLVSLLLKEALCKISDDHGIQEPVPTTKEGWAKRMRDLGVKIVQIAEQDTQVSKYPKEPGEFVNTWSVDGFLSEGRDQPSEAGWGTHEPELPAGWAAHTFGSGVGVYNRHLPGYLVRVRSWTPIGPHIGCMVTHDESLSIADYYTLRDGGKVVSRPTVYYAYRPCPAAMESLDELAARNGEHPERQRIIVDDTVQGKDVLGVLLIGETFKNANAFWYGSVLSMDQAKKLVPHNNATSLQVAVTAFGGMIWAMEHPTSGLLDANEIPDWKRVLDIARPYLGDVVGEYTKWSPLDHRKPADAPLFEQKIDLEHPFALKNFLL